SPLALLRILARQELGAFRSAAGRDVRPLRARDAARQDDECNPDREKEFPHAPGLCAWPCPASSGARTRAARPYARLTIAGLALRMSRSAVCRSACSSPIAADACAARRSRCDRLPASMPSAIELISAMKASYCWYSAWSWFPIDSSVRRISSIERKFTEYLS